MSDPRKIVDDPAVQKRMQVAFELYEAAQVIMRQNLRRRYPDLSPDEIEQRLIAWRHHRPGAEHGDGVGRPIPKEKIDEWLASRRSRAGSEPD